jgi:hypothetical protein
MTITNQTRKDYPMNKQFYTTAPVIGPVYTLQFFNVNDATQDKTVYTDKVMDTIREMTNGETFYYQFDNADNTAHCITARFNDYELIVISDEILTTALNSDLLTISL